MNQSNNKAEYIEVKKGNSPKSPGNPINQIMLMVLVFFCIFLLVYNLAKVPAQIKADPLPSDYLACRILWNETQDDHTRLCCETCQKMKVDYSFDIQYQSGDAIIDMCQCVDSWRNKMVTAWSVS